MQECLTKYDDVILKVMLLFLLTVKDELERWQHKYYLKCLLPEFNRQYLILSVILEFIKLKVKKE